MKAFLLGKGVPLNVLKGRFGHSLTKLTEEAISQGLVVGGYLQHALRLLDDPLADRYLEEGARAVLSNEAMFAVCAYLNSKVAPPIYAAELISRSPPVLERDAGDQSVLDAEMARVQA